MKSETKSEIDEAEFSALFLLLSHRRSMEFTVVSNSMTPLIAVGARIKVESLQSEPSRFDILVFWDGRRLICHYLWHLNQIVDRQEGQIYVTRNLISPIGEDLPVVRRNVLGRVTNYRIPTLTRAKILWRAIFRKSHSI